MGDAATKENGEEVFITGLHIHNVRHLEGLHIPLSKTERKHLILTGKNGSGKTSVLESLKHTIWSGLEGGTLDIGGPLVKSRLKEMSLVFNDEEQFRRDIGAGNFLLSFYRAKRKVDMTTPSGPQKIQTKEHYTMDESPGKNFVQYMVNQKTEKSFANDDGDSDEVQRIEEWFDTFEKSLKEIFDDPSLILEFDRKNFTFKILQEGREPFDFNTMADGFSAALNIVTDLILRMEKSKSKSYDVQGVVLIDELEAHLHIDLQKKILPFLTRFFPRVQFIVSTHSPFVLNSIEDAVIYDLEKNILVNDLSGYAYDGIVEGYFENDKYSAEIKEKIKDYEKLIHLETRSETEDEQMMDLRKYLENIPDQLAPELKMKFRQIELDRVADSLHG